MDASNREEIWGTNMKEYGEQIVYFGMNRPIGECQIVNVFGSRLG